MGRAAERFARHAAQPIRFEVRLPGNVTLGSHLSVSPDGRKLIFTATGVQPGLWIHDLATVSEWRKLPATEGACSPFWSPDSKFVAFATANQIRKINISDGSAQTLCTSSGAAAGAWSPDGMIVFAGASGIRRISADGGEVTDLTTVDHARGETFHALPSFLPDGKHFIYRCDGPGDVAAMFAASLDARPADQQRQPILPGLGDPMYLNGNLLFLRGDTLMVQPFDATRLQLRGEAAPVAEHVAVYSVSAAGVLAYSNDRANAAITVVLNWSADLQPDMKH